jgi:glutathione gamma-glutamylcysteinyltransferase
MVIPMISPKGKTLFKEAMNAGYMEAYFHLSDQFITQAEPFSCGPSTLAMMLNVLEIDPRTNWKG